MNPKVTFIVPCYKLAHLLSECIESILTQTYEDFEILVMDDCSPDNTPEVVRSFKDPRVRHIRNEPNLGHIPNYNKGIDLARGKYVWLISADDRLRRTDALERYVQVMENNPKAGYAFSPAASLENGVETGVAAWTAAVDRDEVVNGRKFLARLVHRNFVPSPAGLVRKECYERVSKFPADMPYAGDWYLWCAFALHFDVACFAEPMVHYRLHQQSMTNDLTRAAQFADELAVRWRIKRLAQEARHQCVVKECLSSIVAGYAEHLVAASLHSGIHAISVDEFERSLAHQTTDDGEKHSIRARVYARAGDRYYGAGQFAEALRCYDLALSAVLWTPKVWVKVTLLRMGRAGKVVRSSVCKPRSMSAI